MTFVHNSDQIKSNSLTQQQINIDNNHFLLLLVRGGVGGDCSFGGVRWGVLGGGVLGGGGREVVIVFLT